MAEVLPHELNVHLIDLQNNPTTVNIDRVLVDRAGLYLPDLLPQTQLFGLVKQISTTLQVLQQEPSPLTELLQKLSEQFTFADVLSFDPPVDFAAGLGLGDHLVSINKLMIYLLSKATRPSDAATIANRPDVVQALVELWLCTPDTGTAAQAGALIVELLKIDQTFISHPDQVIPNSGTGQGLMWKRVFGDKDVYGTIFNRCDFRSTDGKLSKNQISLAQARLLDVLPTIADMDWKAVGSSHHADVETEHGVTNGGLLDFAARDMVDLNDVLTHCVLLDFYTSLLAKTRKIDDVANPPEQSPSLDYLTQSGLHARVIGYYLNDAAADPLRRCSCEVPQQSILDHMHRSIHSTISILSSQARSRADYTRPSLYQRHDGHIQKLHSTI